MTHKQLVALAARWLRGTRKRVLVLTEHVAMMVSEQPDAVGWDCRGESVLVECKLTLNDFYADHQKPHRLRSGIGYERWYLSPPGVIDPERHSLPKGWGLLEVRHGKVFIIKQAEPWVTKETRSITHELMLVIHRARQKEWEGRIALNDEGLGI